MTLRTLLKDLHKLAAEVGADTPVEVRGLSRRVKILQVKHSADEVAVIQVARRMTKAEKDNFQLGYNRARYKRLRAAGLCTRCTEPAMEGKGECYTCAMKNSKKRRQRFLKQKAAAPCSPLSAL